MRLFYLVLDAFEKFNKGDGVHFGVGAGAGDVVGIAVVVNGDVVLVETV